LATRGRPAILIETINRTLANVVRKSMGPDDDTVLMVSVDDDDKPTSEALEKANLPVYVSVKPREDTIGEKWNRALALSGDLYMPMVDHTVPITPGFDQKMVDAAAVYPDGICAVHIRMANLSFSAYNAMSRKWIDALGGLYPTYFPYWFVDHWTDDLAWLIGRIAYADVAVDASKKPMTQEMREPGWWATWYDAARSLRHKQAAALIDAMDMSLPQKNNMKTGLSWINGENRVDVRSRLIINEGVRAQSRQLVAASNLSINDPRYQRVKQRAVEMVPALLAEMKPTEALHYRNMLTPPTTVTNIQRAFA
jgi:hypothetical protein